MLLGEGTASRSSRTEGWRMTGSTWRWMLRHGFRSNREGVWGREWLAIPVDRTLADSCWRRKAIEKPMQTKPRGRADTEMLKTG